MTAKAKKSPKKTKQPVVEKSEEARFVGFRTYPGSHHAYPVFSRVVSVRGEDGVTYIFEVMETGSSIVPVDVAAADLVIHVVRTHVTMTDALVTYMKDNGYKNKEEK